ncbi:MAG: TonB-dependent receptor, partial [Gammaproteobacteria bacterium]|nr:TonB-dependent receptor [Gammaproteobacteria bacterium]
HFVAQGAGQGPDPGYVVTNNTLTKANFSPVAGTFYGVYDQISRPDESASSNFINLDLDWKSSDSLSWKGQIGTSQGDGKTPTQDVSETLPGAGNGAGYSLHGVGSGPDFNFGATNNTQPFPSTASNADKATLPFGWIFGAQNVDVKDKEDWAKIDGDFKLNEDSLTDFKFGVRYQTHERSSANAIAQGPTFWAGGGADTASYPSTWTNYPSNFNTFGGSIPTGIWYWTPAQLATYNTPCYLPLVSPPPLCTTGQTQRNPAERAYYQYWFDVKEKNTAAYAQLDFKGTRWAANVGVRLVRTEEHAVTYTQVDASTPGHITGSLFGPFIGIPVDHSYTNVLSSANFKLDVRPDLVARFAVAQTMTRADYSALAGFTDLSPPAVVGGTGTGSGGNPDLRPILSNNVDAGLEWYFAKRSLLSAGLFYMDLQNYVGYGSDTKSYLTFSSQVPQGALVPYLLTVPVNAQGRVQGLELSYQQAINDNFGVQANRGGAGFSDRGISGFLAGCNPRKEVHEEAQTEPFGGV